MAEGFWINNHVSFENKRNKTNRLILNFFYSGDKEKSVKVFLKQNVRIPSRPVYYNNVEEAKKIIEMWKDDPELHQCPLKVYTSKNTPSEILNLLKEENIKQVPEWGNFNTFEIEVPKNTDLIQKLKGFNSGDYEKIFRLRGFYPERKVKLDEKLEEAFNKIDDIQCRGDEKGIEIKEAKRINNLLKEIDPENKFYFDDKTKRYEAYLNSPSGIEFRNEFMSKEEIMNLPLWAGDIEKPLWKHDNERPILDERENILKRLEKIREKPDKEEEKGLLKRVSEIEKELTIDVNNVGTVKLYEEEYDAKISWFASIYRNRHGTEKILYTLYDVGEEEINGFKVIKCGSEKDLIKKIVSKSKQGRYVIFSGHNSVYDVTQSRFAAEENKTLFDVAIEGIKPKRDYVRKYLQRMKEDFFYFDTLCFSRAFFPYLKGKIPKTSHKLEDICKHSGIEFKKSINYDELRQLEFEAINGKTEEIKQESARRIASYVSNDVEPVVELFKKEPFIDFLVKLKETMPYCTYTELIFSPRIAGRMNDKKFIDNLHNLGLSGYNEKIHEERVQIFKKRFETLKKEMLRDEKHVNLGPNSLKTLEEAKYSGKLSQVYLPLELWLLPAVSVRNPEWKELLGKISNRKEKIAYLQYLKAFTRDMLVNYYFSKREWRVYNESNCRYLLKEKVGDKGIDELFNKFKETALIDDLNKYYKSFDLLKNHYRSVYNDKDIDEKTRKLIRQKPGKKDKNLMLEIKDFGEAFIDNKDLYMLRNNKESVKLSLSDKGKRKLNTYLAIFKTFDKVAARLEPIATNLTDAVSANGFIYLYKQRKRADEEESRFKKMYNVDVFRSKGISVEGLISQGYINLRKELDRTGSEVIAKRGDYLFVSKKSSEMFNEDIAVPVRDFDLNVVEKTKKKKLEENKDQLQLNFA